MKYNILYRKHSMQGIEVNQLLLQEVYHDIALMGLRDKSGHLCRDHTLSLDKSPFNLSGMNGDIEKYKAHWPRCKSNYVSQSCGRGLHLSKGPCMHALSVS